VTFVLGATVPTGAHRYGAGDPVFTPTIAVGKGWGRFDTQSTIGVNLPGGGTAKLGRQLVWNTAFSVSRKVETVAGTRSEFDIL